MQDSTEIKQKLLIEINNQCITVQGSIAKNYDKPNGKELLAELSKLRLVLDKILTI